MTITSHWVEPIDAEHHDKIIAVFHKFFIDKGGQEDGFGFGEGWGHGDGRGDGYGYGDCDGGSGDYDNGNIPEEWRTE